MIQLENISFDHCIKCTICTAYCPVARVTDMYPGPKHSGPDAERLRIKNPELIDPSVKYCNNCKRCEISCPSDVNIATIIRKADTKIKGKKNRFRDYIMSRTDIIGSFATVASALTNALNKSLPVKVFLDLFMKISFKKDLPEFAEGTFQNRFKSRLKKQNPYDEKVIFFHGCYINYYDHKLGEDTIRLLNAMNTEVCITDEKCCGVPLIANGYIRRARVNAKHNIKTLTESTKNNKSKIVTTSSTCAFALKHEYPEFLGLRNDSIAERVEYITTYIYRKLVNGDTPEMKPLHIKSAYHPPCHLERLGSAVYTKELLKMIPGMEINILNSECCGLSGTYGYKKEYYSISQEIGENLFRQIHSINPDIVITDCETCKWQIEMNTSFEVIHPVTLLARSAL